MKILFLAAEITPIIKVGGLADVVGALPQALRALGHDVRVMIPDYGVLDHVRYPARPVKSGIVVNWRGRKQTVAVSTGSLTDSDLPLYYLRCPEMFSDRNVAHGLAGIYANSNDPELLRREVQRFVFFSWAAATVIPRLAWQPEVVHCHDWHTALFPIAQKLRSDSRSRPTVLTIHNLQNQGRWAAAEVFDWLGWHGQEHPALKTRDNLKNLNLLQLGIVAASAVNTVSPTYAREILTPAYGEGLVATLSGRLDGVRGILNGLDTVRFNPAADPDIVRRYTVKTAIAAKAENRSALLAELGVKPEPGSFLIGSVGRLSVQKGYHLLAAIAPRLFKRRVVVVVLGSGMPDIQAELTRLAKRWPHQFCLVARFDARLAQRVYAAADAFMMPSKFEPCGLGQLIAMRYGTLPIVRATGGLADTVTDCSVYPDAGTGFVFRDFSAAALSAAVTRAEKLYHQPERWSAAVTRAMNQDYSWSRSAKAYQRLYDQIRKK